MATTIADYTNLAIKGLQEPFKLGLQANLEQYKAQPFIKYYNTSEYAEIFSSLESMDAIRDLGELETPDVLSLEEGYNITLTAGRKGGSLIVSETTMVRAGDDTTKIDAYLIEQRNQLLKSTSKKIMDDAFYAYNHAFDTGSTVNAPDGLELCATHTYNGGGTFVNETTGALSETTIDTAWEYAGAFTDQGGREMPLNWTAIMVKKGSAAAKKAKQLFGAENMVPTSIDDINIYSGELTIVETPFISTANKLNWFLIDTNIMDSPVICGMVKTPTFSDPITLENNSIRSNVTGYWKTGIAKLPINVYGSTGQ
jgi:hypothetical protein